MSPESLLTCAGKYIELGDRVIGPTSMFIVTISWRNLSGGA